MNVRKLKNFAKFGASIPRKNFNMDLYCSAADVTDEKSVHTCDTQACLAGWEVLRQGYALKHGGLQVVKISGKGKNKKIKSLRTSAQNFAAKSLGLTYEEAQRLFIPWSTQAGTSWDKFRLTPKGAAKRILHMAETGE